MREILRRPEIHAYKICCVMIGYGENLGSGFPMIVSAWKAAGWGEPVLKNQIDLDEVDLSLPVQEPTEISENYSNENKRTLSDVLKNVPKDVLKKKSSYSSTMPCTYSFINHLPAFRPPSRVNTPFS